MVLETRITYFKKEPHSLMDQPRICRIFMLRCIKSIYFLTKFLTSLVYTVYKFGNRYFCKQK